MRLRFFATALLALLIATTTSCVIASESGSFQLMVSMTPWGYTPPADWLGVANYSIAGSGGVATRLADIPDGFVHDPSGLGLRSPNELLVANRTGGASFTGSASRFAIGADGSTTWLGDLSCAGMNGVNGVSGDIETGDVYVASCSGIFRYAFNDGTFTSEGSVINEYAHDVLVDRTSDTLFCTAAHTILRYRLNGDGTLTELTPIYDTPNCDGLTFLGSSPNGDVFVTAVNYGKVWRYSADGAGNLTFLQEINIGRVGDLAFSPDGQEMFATQNAPDGGVARFAYNTANDSWTQTGFIPLQYAFGVQVVSSVPEPSTVIVLLSGIGGMASIIVRRKK